MLVLIIHYMNLANARSRADLIESIRKTGATPDYLFFWGHTPKVPSKVDASCFSNWFPAPFELDGVRYATSEHHMMAGKARLFNDPEQEANILAAKSPGEAKKYGRLVQGFDDETWKAKRFDLVVEGNVAKFEQHPEMGELLRHTGEKILVEAAPRDRIWGIGMGRNNEHARSPENWRGQNLLGFALMEVRSRLA